MPLDTARLATLGLTVAMPLPATWTGVAVDHDATPATPAPDAPADAASAPGTAPAALADPAILPFSFPLPEGVRLVMGSDIVADPRLGLQALIGGALVRTPDTASATPAADAAASPEPAVKTEPEAEDTTPVDRHLIIGALATLTTSAAHALGAHAEWGTLETGRLADLVVLSADLFELPASHLLDAVVIATVVDGKVVYDRDADTPPPTP
jgi:predicted amidohydrolase YtcJ